MSGIDARRVALRSGTWLRVVESGPDAGPPVLLLPGWGGSAFLFSRNIPALADAGMRVMAVDLVGHGASDKPSDASCYTLEAFTTSIVDLMDALALHACALVGQSFGGRIATEVALRHPGRVTRLALIGSLGFGHVSLDALLGVFTALMPLRVAHWFARPSLFRATLRATHPRWRAPSDEAMAEFFAPATDPAFARALLLALRQMDRHPLDVGRVRTLPMPLLYLVGDRDHIVRPLSRSSALGEWLRERTVTIPNAGHLANFDAPATVNAALIEFLSAKNVKT